MKRTLIFSMTINEFVEKWLKAWKEKKFKFHAGHVKCLQRAYYYSLYYKLLKKIQVKKDIAKSCISFYKERYKYNIVAGQAMLF